MAEGNQQVEIPRVKLGNQGFEVSKLGLGCMNLSGGYNTPVPDEDGISTIKYAFNKGITFFNTSDVYGPLTNEILIGKALKQLPREKVQLATKFGLSHGLAVTGDPTHGRSSCEASLARLGVEHIDLYYHHRVDTSIPIEETVNNLFSFSIWCNWNGGVCSKKRSGRLLRPKRVKRHPHSPWRKHVGLAKSVRGTKRARFTRLGVADLLKRI